jgi:CheY-like chemotaxis protein
MAEKKRILIIDDEPTMIVPVLDRLEYKYGSDSYTYTQYFSDDLNVLKTGNISCIYLDLIMPKDKSLKYSDSLINGLNALKQIRELYPDLPIVCYSVVNEEGPIQSILNNKATTYISKTDNDGFNHLIDFFEKNIK